jgi:hypothetical protein
MADKIKEILQDLERVRESMLALSDDIWLSIEHNEPEALKEGYEFKQSYNEKMIEFDRLASEISALVQQYTSISLEEPEKQILGESRESSNNRIIKELDKEEAHTLDENFTYKRPYGFVLCGKGVKDVVTWKRLFERCALILREKSPDIFSKLPENSRFVTTQGNSTFADSPGKLRVPLKLSDEVYAEVNLSAKGLCKVIKDLLKTFDVLDSEMKIYLRQDRDAEVHKK